MGQHTPGPWDYDMGDFTVFQPETGDQIVEMWGDQPQEQIEANARLISAAPDLYAALQTAFTSAAWRHPSHCECEVCEMVRAALLKVEEPI